MGRLGLAYTIDNVLEDLRSAREEVVLMDASLNHDEKQAAIQELDRKIRRYRQDFRKNLDDIYPPDVKKHLHRDIKETKRGR